MKKNFFSSLRAKLWREIDQIVFRKPLDDCRLGVSFEKGCVGWFALAGNGGLLHRPLFNWENRLARFRD